MESRAKLFGHPVHPMLIVFPLGLLATSLILDLYAASSGHRMAFEVSYWMIGCGIIGGLLAAPFGLVDWLAIPKGTRARAIGLWHGAGNLLVVLLFVASWFLRRPAPDSPGALPLVLSIVGVGIALITGWMGGEMVDRLGVGVDDGAHLDAPSSLAGHRIPGGEHMRRA